MHAWLCKSGKFCSQALDIHNIYMQSTIASVINISSYRSVKVAGRTTTSFPGSLRKTVGTRLVVPTVLQLVRSSCQCVPVTETLQKAGCEGD